jgi:hypothetical protein
MTYLAQSIPVTGYTPPTAVTVAAGTISSGTIDNAKQRDNTYLVIDEDITNGLEVIFDFTLPFGEKARRVELCGRYSGGSDHYLDVFVWDWNKSVWKEISTLNNKDIHSTDRDQHLYWDFDIPDVTDANGNVRVRFLHNSPASGYDSGHSLYVDKIGAGDYKSPQLLADVAEGMTKLYTKIANDYISVEATGDTHYQLSDPRLRGADLSKAFVTADISDDSDFQGVRIPVVGAFSTVNTPDWIVGHFLGLKKYVNNFFSGLTEYTSNDVRLAWGLHLIELENKDVLLAVIIPGLGTPDTKWEILWKVLPENFTERDANVIPWKHQVFSSGQQLPFDTLNDVHLAQGIFAKGRVYISYTGYDTTNSDYRPYIVSFDFSPETGFNAPVAVLTGFATHANAAKLMGIVKAGAGVLALGPSSTGVVQLREVSGESVYGVDIATSYYNWGGVAICPYYGDSNYEYAVLVAVPINSTTVRILKVEGDKTGFQTPVVLHDLSFSQEPSTYKYDSVWGYATEDGEVVFSFKDWNDDYQDYFVSHDFGQTFTYEEDWQYASDTRPLINSDKAFWPITVSAGNLEYRLYAKNRQKLAECLIDANSLTIDFSVPPIKGTTFAISDYLQRPVEVINKTRFNEQGEPVIEPFGTNLIDPSGKDAVGEVSSSPTPNTILGRLAQFQFDTLVGSRLVIIGHLHDLRHDGELWYLNLFTTLALQSTTYQYLFVGHPTKSVHISFGFDNDQKMSLHVQKMIGATPGTDISNTVFHNADHSITGLPGSKFYSSFTGGTPGMTMDWIYSDKESVDHEHKEHILAPGEQVLVSMTPDKDSSQTFFTASFYEV